MASQTPSISEMASPMLCAWQPQDRSHGAGGGQRAGRHELAALDDEFESGLHREDARDGKRSELSQGVTRHDGRLHPGLDQGVAPAPVGEIQQRLGRARVREFGLRSQRGDRTQVDVGECFGCVE